MRIGVLIFIFLMPFCLLAQGKKICSKKLLSTELKANDTLFITQSNLANDAGSERLGIIKLPDGRYKTLQYIGSTNEIRQDFMVPAEVYESVIKAEKALKKKSKTTCKDITYLFKLKKKYYSIAENNCDNTTMDKIKSQLFLIKGK